MTLKRKTVTKVLKDDIVYIIDEKSISDIIEFLKSFPDNSKLDINRHYDDVDISIIIEEDEPEEEYQERLRKYEFSKLDKETKKSLKEQERMLKQAQKLEQEKELRLKLYQELKKEFE